MPTTTKHVLEGINFANFLQNFLEQIKISHNSYLENSFPKFARRCAGKNLIYLNLYKTKRMLNVMLNVSVSSQNI